MTRTISHSPATRWLLGIGLVLGLVAMATPARGQADPTPARARPRPPLSERRGATPAPAEAKPDAPAPPEPGKAEVKPEATKEGFLGDTKKFTRLGGWGSMGGAMGQFGVARSMLVMMPPVQAELKLTPAQQKQIREVQEQTRKRGEDMGRSMREKGGDPFKGGEDMSVMARVGQFTGMMGRISELMRENEDEFATILTAGQRKRLGQIALQMEGITALTRPEIADALGLYEIEQEEIQKIVAQSRMMQMTSMVGTMMSLRSERARPDARRPGSDRPGQAEASGPAAKKADPKEPADPKARAERERAVRERFGAMRSNNDLIQDRAVREISRYLNKAQRAKFLIMLGPPFDPDQLNKPGPATPQRPEARPDDAKKSEAN